MAAAEASSRSNAVVVTVAFIISLIIFLLLPLTTSGQDGNNNNNESLVQRKMVLGSKPPACVDKCLSCRPCVATLVVPSHKNFKKAPLSSVRDDDDSYYLLSWKCRCGNKLFQP